MNTQQIYLQVRIYKHDTASKDHKTSINCGNLKKKNSAAVMLDPVQNSVKTKKFQTWRVLF